MIVFPFSLTIIMNLFAYAELLETTAALLLHSIPIMSTFEIDVYQTIMVRLMIKDDDDSSKN